MTHANGVVTSYTYDAASQLTTLAHQLGVTPINSFVYTYDKVGNRKTKVDQSGPFNYTYDTLNRLTQAVNPLPSNPLESFTYDAVGNRTTSNQNGASSFNVANQLLEDANFTYQYDNNGNLTLKTPKTPGPFTSFEYDAENKLVRAVTNGTTTNYKYDGLGRRVEKEVINVGTTVTRYVYDNEDILLELNGSNTIVARYTHGPGIDEPLIMEKNSQAFYYHADGLGSITEITNQSGTVAQRYTYSSFGKIESQLDLNFVQPYTYTSREFDPETGLYHYRARSYDANIGRFLQTDPIGFAGGSNFYTGVSNNPTTFIDPYGLYAGPISPGSGPFPAIDLQSGIPIIDYTVLSTINTIINTTNLAANSIVNALRPIVELAGSDEVLNLGIAIPGPDPVEGLSRASRLICAAGPIFKGADSLRRGNKQALDALRQALKEADLQYSDKLRQQFHRQISKQGIETYQDLLTAAREFVESKKPR